MTMECARAREAVSEAVSEADVAGGAPADAAARAEWTQVEAHLADCAECAAFAARQRALDAQLTAMFEAPSLSAHFRQALRARVRGEMRAAAAQQRRAWLDALPDVVHFASCGLATIGCAVALPESVSLIVGVGTIVALVTYVPLLAIRNTFEDAEPSGSGAR